MRIDLEDMERRLIRAIPPHYRAFVADRSLSDLGPTLAAPAELAALNLEQRAEGADGPTEFGFVLYCSDGDCLLLRDGDDSGMVYEWSHETREISGREFHVSDLLKRLSSIPSGELDADDPTVVISRVAPWTRSILD